MKRKLLGLLSIFLIIPILGCSFNGSKDDESVQSSTSLTTICDPSIKIVPLNEKTPYIGFVNGNNTTKYKVEFTNKYGKKSYLDSDYYLLRWGSSDINIVNPNLDKWFVSNGKATITCTYRDYNDNYTDSMEVTSLTRVVEKTTNYSHMLYEVNKTYDLLAEFKNTKHKETLRQKCIEVNNLEEQGDRLYEKAIKRLFTIQEDAIEIIKWTNIFEAIETSFDACENVADCIEEVLMKNS